MIPSADDETPPLIRFRRATRADIESIVSLTDAAYRGEGLGGWTTEAHLVGVRRTAAEAVAEVLAAPESTIILVEIGSDLVGCVGLTKHVTCAVLGMLAVRPELQNQGIGRAIIREAERISLDELAAKEIRMHVLHMRNDIIAWYDRRGYQPNGERAPFPYGDERVGVPIHDDLEFVVLVKVFQ
ncbi:MAG: GNAT family N-acetyltransferase [Actinomycetota bacterium]|nr:GNAT family N-acetyltransferase [Actinomycetota bacterium]